MRRSWQGSLILFGAGYGFEMLAEARWLARCRIHYWGDIDTHGFAILDQLRAGFDHVEAFLMDRATLPACAPLWGEEETQTLRDLPRLNPAESALYDDLGVYAQTPENFVTQDRAQQLWHPGRSSSHPRGRCSARSAGCAAMPWEKSA